MIDNNQTEETFYKFVYVSENGKTGPIATAYSDMETCPTTCAHYRTSCYAGLGDTLRHWTKVAVHSIARSGNETGIRLSRFLDLMRTLPKYSIFRFGIGGDFPGKGNSLNVYELTAIVKTAVSRSLRAFAYTHKKSEGQIAVYKQLHCQKFVINLSCDSVEEVDELAHHGLPLVLTVPSNFPAFARTANGVRLIQCLHSQYGTQCCDCGGEGGPLCARLERDYAITFPAHGTRRKQVDQRFAMPEHLKSGIVDVD